MDDFDSTITPLLTFHRCEGLPGINKKHTSSGSLKLIDDELYLHSTSLFVSMLDQHMVPYDPLQRSSSVTCNSGVSV